MDLRERAIARFQAGEMVRAVAHALTGAPAAWLRERVVRSDLTLRGLAAELAERSLDVGHRTAWNLVHREGLSFKKKRAAKRAGPAAARKRARRKTHQGRLIPNASSPSTRLGRRPTWRRRGDVQAGTEAQRQGPARPLENHDLPRRLASRPIDALWMVDGPINGEMFRLHVEKVVTPH